MDRRTYFTRVSAILISPVVTGCLSDGDSDYGNNEQDTNDDNNDFDGWVNPEEIEDGYTIVHISSDWEIVPPKEANDWNPETVERFRRGFCKRYFVYENVPEGYEIFHQGGCEEGVTMTIENGEGRVVKEITLPEKNPD